MDKKRHDFAEKAQTGQGNALFLILVAVALFAALAYAVTQSGRGSGNIGRETESLEIARMVSYAGALQQAAQRLVLVGGCADATLNFYSTRFTTPADYVTAGAPADKSCDVFDPAGGGIVWEAPPAGSQATGAMEYFITGLWRVGGVGDAGLNEITLITRVPQTMCTQINQRAGISSPIPEDNAAATDFPPSSWTMSWGLGGCCLEIGTDGGGAGDSPELLGQSLGCYKAQDDGNYYFYSVVLAR